MKTKTKLLFCLKIWMMNYPSITMFLYFLNKPLAGFPIYIKTLVLSLLLVLWLVFIAVPSVDKLLVKLDKLVKKIK